MSSCLTVVGDTRPCSVNLLLQAAGRRGCRALLQTMQCAAFLAGMVRSRLIRRAMVLAPKTLLGQWAAELRRCGLGGRVFEYHGSSAADRCEDKQVLRMKWGLAAVPLGQSCHWDTLWIAPQLCPAIVVPAGHDLDALCCTAGTWHCTARSRDGVCC